MTLFWIILLLVILFVIGSATALNALGRGKSPTTTEANKKEKHQEKQP